MSMYLLPKTIIKALDKQRRCLLWQGGGRKRKYHLIRWTTICKSKKRGGLGIKNISNMNVSLLCKWWWRLEMENGIWQDIVKAKYMTSGIISNIKWRLNDSPVWKDLLQVRHIYLMGRSIRTGNGAQTSLWKDTWVGSRPFCTVQPILFDLCSEKDISVQDFLLKNGHILFQRWLSNLLFEQWLETINLIYSYPFTDEVDKVCWRWNKKHGIFSTKSTYDWLSQGDEGPGFKHIWKAKIPYKIKIFMWLLEQNAVLTKDNLLRRNWLGDSACYFCSYSESRDHLFFQCPISKVVWGIFGTFLGATNIPRDLGQYYNWIKNWLPDGSPVYNFGLAAICWAIWKSRNRACFDKKMVKNPIEILIQACAYMKYWTGLYKTEFQEKLLEGVQMLISCAYRVMQQNRATPVLQLLAPVEDPANDEEAEE